MKEYHCCSLLVGIELAQAFVLNFCFILEVGLHCGAQVVLKLHPPASAS